MKTIFSIHLAALVAAALAQSARAEWEPTREILAAAGVKGGLAVQIGFGPSQVAELTALHAGGKFVVQGLDADPAHVDRARATIRAAGSCGAISVVPWADPSRLPYADNLVNLLVVRCQSSVDKQEILRVLRPGGVAVFTTDKGQLTTDKTVKPCPAEMDEWSHWEHGADGNPVSQDSLVGPPRELQWIAGPRYSRQHWGPRQGAAVTAGGRLFTIEDETPTSTFNIADRWVLIARDAFNGVVLWRRELPQWASGFWEASRRKPEAQREAEQFTWGLFSTGPGGRGPEAMQTLVATPSRLFVPLAAGEPVAMLDAATGRSPPRFLRRTGTQEGRVRRRLVVDRRRSSSVRSRAREGDDAMAGGRQLSVRQGWPGVSVDRPPTAVGLPPIADRQTRMGVRRQSGRTVPGV